MKKSVLPVLFRRGVLAAAMLVASTGASAVPLVKVGEAAPDFTVTTFDKRKVTLADTRGRVVVLNYWATWCAPCKAEMPMMDAFHRKYNAQGFDIYAVTTEGSVPTFKLRPLQDMLSFPLASKLSGKRLGTIDGAVPTSYVIDRKGVVRYAKAGAFDEATFKAVILPLLAEPAP